VLHHHERWDGAGYPEGMAAESIPVEARLLGVADAFDAMTSHRPYRRALTVERALAEVRRCAGTQFDPELALAFVEGWERGEIVSPARPLAVAR
jgi:HD-GYP domain-containing protein (c-di-GMP phosphodiesterase class II)